MRVLWLAAMIAAMIYGTCDQAGAAEEKPIEFKLLDGTVGCEDPNDAWLLEAALRTGDSRAVGDLQATATCRDLTRMHALVVLESDGLVLASVWRVELPDYRTVMWIPIAQVVAAIKAQGLLSNPPAEDPAPAAFPLSFEEEAKRLAAAAGCHEGSVAQPIGRFGRVYSCILGDGQTVKLFVNEAAGTGRPADVVLIWNDWTKDAGFGLHADADLAFQSLAAIGTLYAPAYKPLLLDAFTDAVDRVVEAGDYRIEFTVHRGPEIMERVVRVKPTDP